MIYLILTIVCGALISIALRFAEGKVASKTGMLSMNYLTRGVAIIVVVSLAGVVLFKERLNRRQWAAMVLVLAAIVLLNI